MATRFENFLNTFDEQAWDTIVDDFLPAIHEVDREAIQIWFRFFPLSLHRYLQDSEDIAEAKKGLAMKGAYELKEQVDSSHHFLYGHRFWGEAKHAISNRIKSFDSESGDIYDEIKQLAKSVAMAVKADESIVVSIVLAGLMTLIQAGSEAFDAAEGKILLDARQAKKSAKQILADRLKGDSQGLFGFLKTVDKQFTVTFNENREQSFKAYLLQELTSASAKCNVQIDERCIEGPIPVECTSAACGTCWVGIVAGRENLSEVTPLESKAMKTFGYKAGDDSKPFMRLSCQAKAQGAVTIAIPSWNGVFGKKVYGTVVEADLTPATTSAKKLREVIAEAAGK